MWKYTHSLEAEAKIEKIWRLYSNVDSWPKWDRGLEKVTLDGEFLTGTEGMIKPVDQDWMKFKLIEVDPLVGFSDETKIPATDSVIRFVHTITKLPSGKTKITHTVSIHGKDSDILGKTFGPTLASGIPEIMKNIASLAITFE